MVLYIALVQDPVMIMIMLISLAFNISTETQTWFVNILIFEAECSDHFYDWIYEGVYELAEKNCRSVDGL